MAQFGFCSGAYRLQSPNADAERQVNLYCEQSERTGAKTGMSMLHTPGLVTSYSLPETAIPSIFPVNGRCFAAAASFYELQANNTSLVRGVLNGPPLSPTQIFSCQTHLLILSNGALYIFALTAFTDSNGNAHSVNSFFSVNMGQFNGAVQQIDFCDGYFFAVITGTNTFQVSNLEDGTTWTGLFISTISYFPDAITSLKVDHREVWFQSGKKSIAYYNSGAGYPPFIPIQGAFLEDGSAATFGTVQANDTICWISQDERGWGQAKIMGGGYVGQVISDLGVEFAWQSYSTIADAVCYAYQDQGHKFLVVRFPTADKTWVYDFSTGMWHERGFWNQSYAQYSAHRSTCHAFAFGKHLVGDWKSGNIYQMSIDIYQDFGNQIRWLRRSPTISKENKWIYHGRIEFDLESGLGPQPPLLDGNGQPRAPQAILEWCDNSTLTPTSNAYYLNCGEAGQFNTRVYKSMLGRARKRWYQLSGTDPVPWRIANAYLEATCEGQPIYKTEDRLSDNLRKVS